MTDDIGLRVRRVVGALTGFAAIVQDEDELSAAVRRLLDEAGLAYETEVRLGRDSRIDFLVDGVGVELKVADSGAKLLRQLDRYAASPMLDALVVVTTSRRLARVPPRLRAKPIVAVCMGGL